MFSGWIRQVAFWASVLLALCILDAQPELVGAAQQSPKAETFHLLSLQVQLASIDGGGDTSATVSWRTTILREEEPPPFGARPSAGRALSGKGYRPVSVVEGVAYGDATKNHAEEIELPSGTYWSLTHASGYLRIVKRFDLIASQSLVLELTPAAELSVKILVERGEDLAPLSGATVLVGQAGELAHGARSNKEGRAQFSALPPGPQRVRIFSPGYEPYEALAEGELLVRLRPVSTLRVRVVDDGVVQQGARVFIAGVQLWPARSTETDAQGAVDIAGLKPGRYALYASKGGRVSKAGNEVTILAESSLVEIELELDPGEWARVLVRSLEDQEPIPGARVTWSSAGLSQFSRHARSDGEGRAALGPLSESGGVLSVRAQGFVARIVAVEEGRDRGEAQVVELLKAGVVEGRVVDAGGYPIEGATVEVVGSDIFGMPVSRTFRSEEIADAHFDWTLETTATLMPAGELGVMLGPVPPIPLGAVRSERGQRLSTGAKGYFRVTDLPPGELVVLVRHPEHMDGRSEVLVLKAGETKKTEIALGQGVPLRGRVLDHRGFPVEGARIRLTSRKYDRRVVAESDGSFSVSAAPDLLRLSVSRVERPLRTVFSRKVTAEERGREVLLKLPAPREEAAFRIEDSSGDPVGLAQVTLVSLMKEIPFKQTQFSSDEGTLSFDEAVGLRVQVRMRAPGFVEVFQKEVLKTENTFVLLHSLKAAGKITGVRGRLPASGARVEYRRGGVVRRATADDLGEYLLSGLAPGAGELSVSHSEYGKGHISVFLKDPGKGRNVQLPALDLAPILEVSGWVKDGSGKVVSGASIASDRLSPFYRAGGGSRILGVSDEKGGFTISVEREDSLYLYAALPARSYGWSDRVQFGDLDRVQGIVITVDQSDRALPDAMATLLVGLAEQEGALHFYALAPGSGAQRAGLKVDDILLEVDGSTPEGVADARDLLSGAPGTEVQLLIERGGKRSEVLAPREVFQR